MSMDVVGMLVATNFIVAMKSMNIGIYFFRHQLVCWRLSVVFNSIIILVVVVKVVSVVVVAVVVTEVIFGHLFSLLLEPGYTSKQPSSCVSCF